MKNKLHTNLVSMLTVALTFAARRHTKRRDCKRRDALVLAVSQPEQSESRAAQQLLEDIRMDAQQVRARAWEWTMYSNTPTSTWYDFDKEWHQINPPVQDMNKRMKQLEDIKASLPGWERTAINEGEALVTEIASTTHTLRTQLDSYFNNMANLPVNATSKTDSRVLAQTADHLVQDVEPPSARTS